MISKNIVKEMTAQINAELYSAYLYLAMSSWFENANWGGFATWLSAQAKEEMGHAMKFYKHLNDRGAHVTFDAIKAPQNEWKDPLDAFKTLARHEAYITARILKLVALANKENDAASQIFLQWFVTEQVEEEKRADEIVRMLDLIKNAPHGLFMLNAQLGKREG
jgi:ferritin